MPIFKYDAIKQNGESFSGEVNFNTAEDVRAYLKEKEYFVVNIKELKSKIKSGFQLFGKVHAKDLSIFCRKLYAMVEAGLPIVTSIEILKEQTIHKSIKYALNTMYENLQKGYTFSEALKVHSDVFPDIMIFMIESGEMSGSIDMILDRLATDFEKEAKIRNTIKAAMVYPILLAVAATTLITFMLTSILPKFMFMFDNSGVELPKLTQTVIDLSDSLVGYWYFYLIGLISILALVKIIRGTHIIRRHLDLLKITVPMFKKYNTLLITTRFTRTLSTMLYSGVPLLNCLENVSKAVGNKIIEEQIIEVGNEVRRGSDLASPIKRMNFFPRMVDSMINIGEESGALDAILVKTTNYFEDELETTIKQMTVLFEPLMIVMMGVIIGTIVIAMLLPMFEIMNTV